MANTIIFRGYSRASGRTPFMRIFEVAFSGNSAAANAEVLDFTKALNPNGLEDAQIPSFTTSFAPPMIVGSTLQGYQPELEIGGNGTAGQTGITFYDALTALAAATAYSGIFPANAAATAIAGSTVYGQVLVGVLSSE